jgi:hypothetical protein
MLRRIVGHVSRQPVAYLALFFAMTGTGLAAKPAITGRDIKNESITGGDIKDSSITTYDVRSRSLLASDFKAGQLPAGAPGPEGPAGAAGATGPQGPPGAAAATNIVMRQGPTVIVRPESFEMAEAACLPGERATGGGLYNGANLYYLQVTSSYPTPNAVTRPPTADGKAPTGWRVWVANTLVFGENQAVEAYVICAAP